MTPKTRPTPPAKTPSRHDHLVGKSTPESVFSGRDRVKSVQAKKAKFALRKRCKIPLPLRAIRDGCLECMGGQSNLVKECNLAKKCAFWPYRMGRAPTEEDLQCAQYDKQGNVRNWIHYEECKKRGEKYNG